MHKTNRVALTTLAGLAIALALPACSSGESNPGLTSLGSPGYGPGGTPMGTDGSDDGSDGSDDSGSGNGSQPPDDPPTDDPNADGGDTGGPPDMPPPGDDAPTDDGDEPPPNDSGGGDGDGSQPISGMYAPCTEADQIACNGGGCMVVTLPTGPAGYCTAPGCVDGSFDCDPAPVGSAATPMCMPVGADSVCALGCAASGCPAGMECVAVALDEAETMVADICV